MVPRECFLFVTQDTNGSVGLTRKCPVKPMTTSRPLNWVIFLKCAHVCLASLPTDRTWIRWVSATPILHSCWGTFITVCFAIICPSLIISKSPATEVELHRFPLFAGLLYSPNIWLILYMKIGGILLCNKWLYMAYNQLTKSCRSRN